MSYVNIDCLCDETQAVLEAVLSALVYADINPSTADRLVKEQRAQWNSRITLLDKQMELSTMRSFYRGTAFDRYYDIDAPVLYRTDIHSMLLAYTQLLDASLYSLAFVGNISPEDAFTQAQDTFGILFEQTERGSVEDVPPPVLKAGSRKVQLHHLYTTTMTADMAGDTVPVLVPTTEYRDPVQYYFPAPADGAERVRFNALLIEMGRMLEAELGSDALVSVTLADRTVPVGCLQAKSVARIAAFDKAWKKIYAALEKELSRHDSDAAERLSLGWLRKVMAGTQTNDGTARLLQEGIMWGTPYQYLDDYIVVEKSSQYDYAAVLKDCFAQSKIVKVYSESAK